MSISDTLKTIRERKDLKLSNLKHLNKKFTGYDGKEQELKIRYYQIQGALHLFATKQFILGDHCGLGKTLQTLIALCCIWEKNPEQKAIIATCKSSVPEWTKEFVKFTNGVNVIYVKDFAEKPSKKVKLFSKKDRIKIDEIFSLEYGHSFWSNSSFEKLAFCLIESTRKKKEMYVQLADRCHTNIKNIIEGRPLEENYQEIFTYFKFPKTHLFEDKRYELIQKFQIPIERAKRLFTNQLFFTICYLYEISNDEKLKTIILKIVNEKPLIPDDRVHYDNLMKEYNLKNLSAQDQREEKYKEFLEAKGPTVLLTSYGKLTSDIAFFQTMSEYVFITDECTAYKTTTTNTHQACAAIARNASRVWGLTATLIKNNLMEGFGVCKVIIPELFKTKSSFMQEYCIVVLQKMGGKTIPTIKGSSARQIERFKTMIEPFYLGRAKQDVASELPPVTIKEINIPMTEKEKELYEEILSGQFQIGEGEEAKIKEVEMLAAINYCQQVVNHPKLIQREGSSSKLNVLIDLLTEGDLSEEKVVVFSRFRSMVDIAIPELEKRKIKCVRVTGSENEKERKTAMEKFQDENNDVRVIFITLAGSHAINLQTGKAIIFYDTPYSGGDFLQCLGRISRIGSKHDNLYCIHLVCEDTVDERVMGIHKSKMKLIENVLGKQIKTNDSEETIDSANDISDLFKALKQDAYKNKRK